MLLSQAIEKLSLLRTEHGDIDVAFDVQADDPDSPLGNDFVGINVETDQDGFYAVFVTTPRRVDYTAPKSTA